MHYRRTFLIAIIALLSVTACANASAGWTYQPPPPATPVASVEASAGASAGASAEASAGASAGASGAAPSEGASAAPSGSAAAGGSVVQISALGIKFEQASVQAPANAAFQIAFDNKDAGVPHNVAIHQGDANGAEVFKGEIVTGVVTATYDVGPLAPGAYTFICNVHPTMTGTLTVQ